MVDFVHLHTHSVLSLLDGMSPLYDKKTGIKDTLAGKAAQMGQKHLAVTDHGNMYGVVKHSKACEIAGINPIFGNEVYLTTYATLEEQRAAKSRKFQHMTLLAETDEGLENLYKLTSLANTEGFWYKPTVNPAQIIQNSAGIIALSGCVQGPVAQALKAGEVSQARILARMYKEAFPGRYFIEVHDHGMPDQPELNKALIALAKQLDLPIVAANDSHYLNKSDAEIQDILLAAQMGERVTDAKRGINMIEWPEFYLKSGEEMAERFPVEYLTTSVEIAERCVAKIKKSEGFPRPAGLPDGVDEYNHLRRLAYLGLQEKYGVYGEEAKELTERLDYELKVINDLGYVRYFLIVADLMRFAHEAGIPSSARGSAAGSLVAYSLGITPVDPIAFRLSFERFLSPGRSPDIDLDFADLRRHEVMEYAARAYGEDRVAQIVTFGTIGGRSAVRDAGRALGFDYDGTNALAKLIPQPADLNAMCARQGVDYQQHYELAAALEVMPQLQAATGGAGRVLAVASRLEGIKRQSGTHAGGMVISADPLQKRMAVQRIKESTLFCTQLDMDDLEYMNDTKFDILGLATLTIKALALDLIEKNRGEKVDLARINQNDPKTLALLARGETHGVFQLESAGMRRYLKQLKPSGIADLQAMVALYRPGPLGDGTPGSNKVEAYIARKHGEEAVTYYDPILEPILKDTYGLLVYQEAIMQISQKLLGFDGVQADKFLYAVRKKQKDRLAEYEEIWFEKAAEKGVARAVAQKLWDDIQPFARYGFNQAHAACYGTLAYETAYLKANYTPEFMSALLTSEAGKSDAPKKVAVAVSDARRMGVPVLPPDINKSGEGFTVEDGAIRFGLLAVKGVGAVILRHIIDGRQAGPFTDLEDFRKRVKKANVATIKNLIMAGAFDYCGTRAILIQTVGGTVTPGRAGKLADEREVLGLCISEHAIAPYASALETETTIYCAEVGEEIDGELVTIAGVVTEFKPIKTKKGEEMCMGTIEDETGQVGITIFPRVWMKAQDGFKEGRIAVIKGKVNTWQKETKIVVNGLDWVR